jgi:hypothetical protein
MRSRLRITVAGRVVSPIVAAFWLASSAASCGTSSGDDGSGSASSSGGNSSGSSTATGSGSGSNGGGSGSGGSSSGTGSSGTGSGTDGGGGFPSDAGIAGDASTSPSGTRSAAGFFHPGVVDTLGGLNSVRNRLAASDPALVPGLTALKRSINDSTLPPCPAEDPTGACYLPPQPVGPNVNGTPTTTVTCGSHSAAPPGDTTCDSEKANAHAAYAHALLWVLTQDAAEAQKATSFMDAWAGVTTHTGYADPTDAGDGTYSDNSPLQCGWVGTIWARAAEIMRYTYPSWSGAQAFGTYLQGLVQYINLPVPNTTELENGNWQLSEADAWIQISVYNDNMTDYESAVEKALRSLKAYVYLTADGTTPKGGGDVVPCYSAYPSPHKSDGCGIDMWWGIATAKGLVDGTSQETCRDLEHVQYGLGSGVDAAETVAIQQISGVDLYGDTTVNYGARLLAALELHAQLLAGRSNYDGKPHDFTETDPDLGWIEAPNKSYTCNGENYYTGETTKSTRNEISPVDLSATRRSDYPVQPTWDMAYNHFVNVEGKPMPNTLALLVATSTFTGNRPLLASHPLAWETLTKLGTGSTGFPE